MGMHFADAPSGFSFVHIYRKNAALAAPNNNKNTRLAAAKKTGTVKHHMLRFYRYLQYCTELY
jgi:hypothetical protein